MEFVAGCNRRSWLAGMRTRVEISWVDLTASWLTGVELCGVIALHCNAYHGMLWRGWTAAYSFHMMCGVCVVAVVFFIANISLCLPYSYLIAILMLNIKLYVCSVPTTFLHTNNNRNIHISYSVYCDVHIVGGTTTTTYTMLCSYLFEFYVPLWFQ